MIKNRLAIERNNFPKGGWFVSIDSNVKYVETLDDAVSVVMAELDSDAISAERDADVTRLNERIDELETALDKSCSEYERLNADLEQERADKNKWIVEAYDLKETLVKMCKRLVRV